MAAGLSWIAVAGELAFAALSLTLLVASIRRRLLASAVVCGLLFVLNCAYLVVAVLRWPEWVGPAVAVASVAGKFVVGGGAVAVYICRVRRGSGVGGERRRRGGAGGGAAG